jgi:hypothetical protein
MLNRGEFSLSAGAASLGDGRPAIAVKVQGPAYELNVWIPISELAALRRVPSTPWEAGALRIGESAGSPAFWSCDSGEIFIGFGHDDQTWDFGVTFPATEFLGLLSEIERELGRAL